MPGSDLPKIEETNISNSGFGILLDDCEMFVAFDESPWFRNAQVGAILNVERLQVDHLYWPELDVDLSVTSIDNPERYPLKSK